jgi:hypothetical protein
MVHAKPRVGPGLSRFFDDELQGANRQRFIGLVFQVRHAPALIRFTHQADEGRDGAVGRACA